jgi:hypothetical protein
MEVLPLERIAEAVLRLAASSSDMADHAARQQTGTF